MTNLDLSPDGSHGSDSGEGTASVTGHLLEGHSGKWMRPNSIGEDPDLLRDGPGAGITRDMKRLGFFIRCVLSAIMWQHWSRIKATTLSSTKKNDVPSIHYKGCQLTTERSHLFPSFNFYADFFILSTFEVGYCTRITNM